jgi:prophage regulatory protein
MQLPETGFVRLPTIIGDERARSKQALENLRRKNAPLEPGVIPVKKSTWWQGVKDKRFPAPVMVNGRSAWWRVEDIRAYLENPR